MNNNITLVEPTIDLALEFLAMACEFQREKSNFFPEPIYDIKAYIQQLNDMALGRNLKPDMVPCTHYWLVKDGWLILGKSSLRHQLNEYLSHQGGHIGYCVRPTQRGKGYGNLILKLTLRKALALGLDRVLVTCDTDNTASAHVILNNRGVFEDNVVCKKTAKSISRFWIEL